MLTKVTLLAMLRYFLKGSYKQQRLHFRGHSQFAKIGPEMALNSPAYKISTKGEVFIGFYLFSFLFLECNKLKRRNV